MKTELILIKDGIVLNPYFKDDSEWTIGTGWDLDSGYAEHTGGSSDLTQDVLIPGVSYKVTVDFQVFSGALNINLGSLGYGYGAAPRQTVSFVVQADDDTFTLNATNHTIVYKCEVVENPGTYSMDLSEDIDAPVTFNVADVRDPSKRNATYSKTIIIPGTKDNNKVFGHIFEIGSDSTFNPNRKVQAIVLQDGLEVFKGIAQLKLINRNMNGFSNYDLISYEVVLFGRIADIIYQLGDSKLEDLDFSEFDHNYDWYHIVNSWGGYGSGGVIEVNGNPFVSNWTVGAPKTVTARSADADGRLELTFSGAHGFSVDSQIYYQSQCPMDVGDHKVKEVTAANKVVLYHPYNAGYGVTNDICYTRVPLAQGYVYPMLQCARNHPSLNEGNTGSGLSVYKVVDFQPAIYLKQYVDKIFELAGFKYSSNFFNSNLFKRLIVSSAGNGFIQMSQSEIASRQMLTTMLTGQTLNLAGTSGGAGMIAGTLGFGYTVLFDDDSTLPNNDPGAQYNPATGIFTVAKDGFYTLKCNLLVNISATGSGCTSASINTGLLFKNHTTNQVKAIKVAAGGVNVSTLFGSGVDYDFNVLTPNGPSPQIGTAGNYLPVNVFMKAGDQYSIRIRPFGNFTMTGPVTLNVTIKPGSYFEVVATNYDILENMTMEMNSTIPKDIYCRDFLKSLINMFNLYVEADKTNEKTLIIEPRDDFYAAGSTIDWTSKLDISQPINISPLGELEAKEYLYQYKEGKDFYNQEYRKRFTGAKPPGYGDYRLVTDNDFLNSQNKTELIFTATMLDEPVANSPGVTGKPIETGRVISQIFSGELVPVSPTNPAGITVKPGEAGLRILYFAMAGAGSLWALQSSTPSPTTNHYFNTYPYAGHLDHVEGPDFDLNFGYPFGFITLSPYTFDAWTDNNLFNAYHKGMMDEITSKDSKIVTAYFHLKPTDIFKLDFRNTIFVDGIHYRLNKIIDYSLNHDVPTQVELLKANYVRPFRKRTIHNIGGVGVVGISVGSGNGSGGVDPLDGVLDNPVTRQVAQGNYINAGKDQVLDPFNTENPINFIDAGMDEVLNFGFQQANFIDDYDVEPLYAAPDFDGITP